LEAKKMKGKGSKLKVEDPPVFWRTEREKKLKAQGSKGRSETILTLQTYPMKFTAVTV